MVEEKNGIPKIGYTLSTTIIKEIDSSEFSL